MTASWVGVVALAAKRERSRMMVMDELEKMVVVRW
ncbi:hypothetical protein L195_g052913, partial [Trifolium pratense]